MIQLSKYARLLLNEDVVTKEKLKSNLTNAFVSIFDIDQSDVVLERYFSASRSNEFHNFFFYRYSISYKNKDYIVHIQLLHKKVPDEESALKSKNTDIFTYSKIINQLNQMPHVELTTQMLQKTNKLIVLNAAFSKFENIKTANQLQFPPDMDKPKNQVVAYTIRDLMIKLKEKIDDQGFDGNSDVDVPIDPKVPELQTA